MSENDQQDLQEFLDSIKTLLHNGRSCYTRLERYKSSDEGNSLFPECEKVLSQFSEFDYDIVKKIVTSEAPQLFINQFTDVSKSIKDIHLKLKLRFALLREDQSKMQKMQKLRKEDIEDEIRIKIQHLNNLEIDLSHIHQAIQSSSSSQHLKEQDSRISEILMLIESYEILDQSQYQNHSLMNEISTLLALAKYLEERLKTKYKLLKDLELIGPVKLADRLRPNLTSFITEFQDLLTNIEKDQNQSVAADYRQRLEWLMEGSDVELFLSIPQILPSLDSEITHFSTLKVKAKTILENM